jgi:hypothetical protein
VTVASLPPVVKETAPGPGSWPAGSPAAGGGPVILIPAGSQSASFQPPASKYGPLLPILITALITLFVGGLVVYLHSDISEARKDVKELSKQVETLSRTLGDSSKEQQRVEDSNHHFFESVCDVLGGTIIQNGSICDLHTGKVLVYQDPHR